MAESKAPLLFALGGAALLAGLAFLLLGGSEDGPAAPVSPAPAPAATARVDADPAPARPSLPTPSQAPGVRPALEGQVLAAHDRHPLGAARVVARPQGGGEVAMTETDGEGRFRLDVPEAKDHVVVALAEGYLVARPQRARPGGDPLEFLLEPGVRVTGRVVAADGGPGPAGAEVLLKGAPRDRYAGVFPTRVDAAGAFSIEGVPPGMGYSVTVRAEGYAEASTRLPPVRAPGGVAGVLIPLRRFAVAGRVRGEAPGGARIEARHPPPREAAGAGRADEQGRFELALPAAGPYELRALQGEARSPWTPVEVPASGSAPELTLELVQPQRLAGRVRTRGGEPASGARVRVEPLAEGEAETLNTDAEGRFARVLLPGRYRLVASRGGMRSAPREAAPGEQAVELVLERPAGTVTLQASFHDPDGRPLAGLEVRIDADEAEAESFAEAVDAAGRLEVPALQPGGYDLSFVEPADGQLRAWGARLQAVAGEDLKLTFAEREPRGSVVGTIQGTLPDQPAEVMLRPEVEPRDGAFGYLVLAESRPGGQFDLGAVPPGRYLLRVAQEARAAETVVAVEPGRECRVELSLGGQ